MLRFFRRRSLLLASALSIAASTAWSLELAGTKVEDQVHVGSNDLVLNGAGIRTKLVFKVYIAALYVPAKTTSASKLLQSPSPSRIALRLLRDIDADTLIGALQEGLTSNHSASELNALKADVDKFEGVMRSVGNAKKGDLIAIDFTNNGTQVSINGTAKGDVPGDKFAKALLKVWLGEKPVDTDLKQALLGH